MSLSTTSEQPVAEPADAASAPVATAGAPVGAPQGDATARGSALAGAQEPASLAVGPPEGRLAGWRGRLPGVGTAVALVILFVVALWAIAPWLLAPGNPVLGTPADKFLAPSFAHPFGTDHLGRDVLTRVVHGTWRTLATAGLAVGLGVVVGTMLGLLAGTGGRLADAVTMRLADVLLAIPAILIALVVVTAYQPGPVSLGIGVGLASIATFARLTRTEVLRVRGLDFVEASFLSGASRLAVVRTHVLPHVLGPVLALLVVELGAAILAISGLGFLGFGTPPPAPEWGLLVAEGRQYLAKAWWMSTLPGAVIVTVVLSLAACGRALARRGRY
jgi:peptide/nickel transport system permease protein